MKVKALINFGKHKAGDVWTMTCKACALKLIKEGKVERCRD